jgi:hypothetical protein
VGGVVGAIAFCLLLLLGLLLYQRLYSGSSLVLVGIELLFGAVGAYAGWLLGVIVFSAVRGAEEDSLTE